VQDALHSLTSVCDISMWTVGVCPLWRAPPRAAARCLSATSAYVPRLTMNTFAPELSAWMIIGAVEGPSDLAATVLQVGRYARRTAPDGSGLLSPYDLARENRRECDAR
jgi:hypothetical protein